jgi:hypothetical protein
LRDSSPSSAHRRRHDPARADTDSARGDPCCQDPTSAGERRRKGGRRDEGDVDVSALEADEHAKALAAAEPDRDVDARTDPELLRRSHLNDPGDGVEGTARKRSLGPGRLALRVCRERKRHKNWRGAVTPALRAIWPIRTERTRGA